MRGRKQSLHTPARRQQNPHTIAKGVGRIGRSAGQGKGVPRCGVISLRWQTIVATCLCLCSPRELSPAQNTHTIKHKHKSGFLSDPTFTARVCTRSSTTPSKAVLPTTHCHRYTFKPPYPLPFIPDTPFHQVGCRSFALAQTRQHKAQGRGPTVESLLRWSVIW